MSTRSFIATARYDLPNHITTRIGRISVRFSYLEYQLTQSVWLLVGVDYQLGRLVIRDQRPNDRVGLIETLANLKKVKLPSTKDIKDLRRVLAEITEHRNLLVHGLWAQHNDGTWTVQDTSGSRNDQKLSPSKRKRVVLPEASGINFEFLDSLIKELDTAIGKASDLLSIIRSQVPASLDTPPQPSDRWGTPLNQNKEEQKKPPGSSQG